MASIKPESMKAGDERIPFEGPTRRYSRDFAKLQRRDQTFTELVSKCDSLKRKHIESLMEALRGNPYIKTVRITQSNLRSIGTKLIALSLSSLPNLVTLDISGNKLGDECVAEIFSSHLPESIKSIDLSGNSLTHEGIAKIMRGVICFHSLESLYLDKNPRIGVVGAETISRYLPRLLELEKVGLSGCSIGEAGAVHMKRALESSRKLWEMGLRDNSIPEALLRELDDIVSSKEISTPGGETSVEESPSPFFEMLMEKHSDAEKKLGKLYLLIEDVHQMKLYYTSASAYCRLGLINNRDQALYIKLGLQITSRCCEDVEAFVVYKSILNKAHLDGLLGDEDHIGFEKQASLRVTENAKFVRDIRVSLREHSMRSEGLEASEEAIKTSITQLKDGLRRQMRADMAVAFICAVVNVVSLGVGVGIFEALSRMVDFADLNHVRSVADSQPEALQAFETGVEIASELVENRGERKLAELVNEKNPLVTLALCAKLIEEYETRNCSRSIHLEPAPEPVLRSSSSSELTALSSKKSSYFKRTFDDAELDSDEEIDCPLHAAVKFRQLDTLEEELAALNELGGNGRSDAINKTDSNGRTALDLAALTGQKEMASVLLKEGGQYKKYSRARMKHLLEERSRSRRQDSEKALSISANVLPQSHARNSPITSFSSSLRLNEPDKQRSRQTLQLNEPDKQPVTIEDQATILSQHNKQIGSGSHVNSNASISDDSPSASVETSKAESDEDSGDNSEAWKVASMLSTAKPLMFSGNLFRWK